LEFANSDGAVSRDEEDVAGRGGGEEEEEST